VTCRNTKVYSDKKLQNIEMFIQEPETLMLAQTLNFEYEALKFYGLDCGSLLVKATDVETGLQPNWIQLRQQELSIDLGGETAPFRKQIRLEAYLSGYPTQRILQDFNVTLSSLEVTCSTNLMLQLIKMGTGPIFVPMDIQNRTKTVSILTPVLEPLWFLDSMQMELPTYATFDEFQVGFLLDTDSIYEAGEYFVGVKVYYREHPFVDTVCKRGIRVTEGPTSTVENGALTTLLMNGALTSTGSTSLPTSEAQELVEVQNKTDDFRDKNIQLLLEATKNRSPDFKPKELAARFVDITNVGKAVVGFSQDIRIVPDLKMINNSTIYLDQVDFELARALEMLDNTGKARVPILQVSVIPGNESNIEDLQYTWNVT